MSHIYIHKHTIPDYYLFRYPLVKFLFMAQQLQKCNIMKVLLVTNDSELLHIFRSDIACQFDIVTVYAESNDPLDLMSTICSDNPSLLIIDDDFLKPNTAHILKSIKKVKKDVYIIFITSDARIDLGREVSQLGIHFYAHKPLDKTELIESMKSIAQLKAKKNHLDLI